MNLQDLEIDIKYSPNLDTYIKINNDFYSKVEAYKIARMLLLAGNEIMDLIDNSIIDSLKGK
jgi:hypothetical protein